MSVEFLLPALAFGSMLAFAVFALISQRKVLERMDNDDAPKSTLARDKDSHGEPIDV